MKSWSFGLYVLFLVLLSLHAYYNTAYDWDICGYMGSALRLFEDHPDSLLPDIIDADMQRGMSVKDYEKGIMRIPLSHLLQKRPDWYVQQFRFYHRRVLYYSLVYGGYRLGLRFATAARLLSVGCVFGIGLLIWFFVGRRTGWAILTVLVAAVPTQAYILKPGALCSLMTLGAIFLLLADRYKYWAFVLLMVSLLVRPDNLILVGMILVFFGIIRREIWNYWLCVVFGVVIFVATTALFPLYDYAIGFHHTFYGFIANPADARLSLGYLLWKPYLYAFHRGLYFALTTNFYCILFLAFLVFRYLREDSVMRSFLLVVVTAMFFHYVLWPVVWPRFFVTHFVIITGMFVKQWCSRE